jgi:PAS domain S-box-containing protein
MPLAAAVRPNGSSRDLAARLLYALLAACLVCACAWLSLRFTRGGEAVAVLWPANAVLLTFVLHSRRGEPFGLLAAGYLGNFAALLLVGESPAYGAALGFIDTFEVAACFLAIRRFASRIPDLSRPRDLVVFLVSAGVVAPVLAASLAAVALPVLVTANPWAVWQVWYAADALGLLIVMPALCILFSGKPMTFLAPGSRLKTAGLAALLAADLAVVFCQTGYPLLFLIPPVLLLIAFQLDMAACALALLVTAAAAMTAAGLGSGPVALIDGNPAQAIIIQQLFLAVLTLSTLPIAAAIIHRRRLAAEIEQAAAAIDARDRELQLLSDNATDAIGRISLTGEIQFVSAACLPIAGYTVEELVGRDWMAIIHPEDRPAVEVAYAKLISGGGTRADRAVRYRARHKDGSWIWLEANPTLVRTPEGRPVEFIDVVRDIGANKADEDRLAHALVDAEDQRFRLQLISDNASDLISRMDMDGACLFVSPSVVSIMGYEPSQMVGRRYADFMHPEDLPAVRTALQEFARDGLDRPRHALEFRARHKDGHWVWLEGNPTVIRDSSGAPVEYVDVIRDITQRKAVETALGAAREAAEAAAQAKADFLSNMSHELRTPLTSIIGFSGLLSASDGVGPTERKFVTRIETASQALLSVINDVLDYSRLDAGGIELDSRPFDPHLLLSESVGLLAPQAEAKDLSLTIAMDSADGIPLMGDDARLRQVLLNLLSNAVKFTAEGGVSVRAAVAVEGPGIRRLDVTVADTGIGISEDQVDRLFERFTQADGSINRRFGGTGLGLSISQRLIQLMGGDIAVSSRPGQGSEFSFSVILPLADSTATTSEVGPGTSLSGLRILVVDDAEPNRELMTAYLRALDAEVDTACDGAEAVSAVRDRRYDLILMDVNMPVLDGLAATRAIRGLGEAWRDLPIVALTADVGPNHVGRCAAAGMNGHVAKPIVPAELHAALEANLFRKAA